MTAPICSSELSKASLLIDKQSNVETGPKASQAVIFKDIYFPRYKTDDNASAILVEAGLTDITGKVNANLFEGLKIPLSPQEKEDVKQVLNKLFDILDSHNTLSIQVLPKEILQEFFCKNSELYGEIEIIGSAAIKTLGVPFCKRVVEELLKVAFPNNLEKVAQIFKSLFTLEFEGYLNKRFTKQLADIDYRLRGKKDLPLEMKQERCVVHSIDSLIDILVTKLSQLTAEEDKKRRIKALELLKVRLPHMDWNWLAVDNPKFYHNFLGNLAFNKVAVSTKEGELLGIVNIGKSSATTADFVFALDVPRTEIFPSVAIPCRSLLDPKTEADSLFPAGENWVQCLFDKMTGRSRPDLSKATDDDLKMLLCNKTKGDVNPTKSDKELVDIARQHSLNIRHKTVRKILKKNPELRGKPNLYFPYFLAQQLKEAVDTHLGKDPLAAMAITINASEMLTGKVSHDELEIFIREMSDYWANSHDDHPLANFFNCFAESHQLEVHQALARKMPLLKLCAFLYCQAESTESNPIQVYPRKSDDNPCLEAIFKGEDRTYSLLLNIGDTSELFRDALNYYRLPRISGEEQKLNRMISLFQTQFKGPLTSPMLHDLRFFNHNPEVLEKMCQSLSVRTESLILTNILFGLQTQLANRIPLKTILVGLPSVVIKMKDHLPFLFVNILTLIEQPEQKKIVRQFWTWLSTEETYTEEVLAKRWIILMSQHAGWIPFTYDCFVEAFHQNPQVSQHSRIELAHCLFDKIKSTNYQQALKLLQFIQQKQYVSFKAMRTMFKHIAIEVLKNQSGNNFQDDLQRIEIIVESVYAKKPDDVEGFVGMLSGFVAHSIKIKRISDSYKKSDLTSPLEMIEAIPTSTREKIDELIELAKIDYESAANRLFSLKDRIEGESLDRLFVLMSEILAAACKDKDFRLAKSLLSHRGLTESFVLKPESYSTLLLDFNDKAKIEQWLPMQDLALGVILKSCKVSNFSVNILLRLVNQIIQSVQNGFANDAREIRKLLIETSYSLELALQSKQLHQKCIELFHLLSVYIGTEVVNDANATIVVGALSAIKDDETQLKGVSRVAETLLPSLIKLVETKAKKSLFEVIKKIALVNSQPQKVVVCLTQLTSIRPLDTNEDLLFLFALFKKFQKCPNDGISMLENYSGFQQKEEALEKQFRSFILRSIKEKNWSIACRALSCNPFNCQKPDHFEELFKGALETITALLAFEKLSLSDFRSIFNVLNLFSIADTKLIVDSISKSEGIADTQLSEKIWEVFINRLMPSEDLEKTDKIILILTNALKLMNKESVQSILDRPAFIKYASQHLSSEGRLSFFKGLCKAYLHVIKNSKANEKNALFKQFDEKAKVWLKSLWPDSHSQDRKNAVLDLLEIIVAEKGISLLPEIMGHLSSLDHCNHEKDRFVRLLTNALSQLATYSGKPLIVNGQLSIVFSNAISVGVPYLILGKCLKNCHTKELFEVGFKIVDLCLAVESFLPQEMSQLRCLRVGDFLKFVLSENNTYARLVEIIIKHKRLPLFVKREDNDEIQAIFAKIQLAQNVSAISEIEDKNTEKVIDFTALITSLEASADRLEIIASDQKALNNFSDSFYKLALNSQYDDQLKAILLKMVQSENGFERWCLFVKDLTPLLLEGWMTAEKKYPIALEFMVDTINQSAIASLRNAKEVNAKQMVILKHWIQTLHYFEWQPLETVAEKFVEEALPLLKTCPKDSLEMKLINFIMLRKKTECMVLVAENVSNSTKLITDIMKRTRERLVDYSMGRYYEDILFAAEVVSSVPELFRTEECLVYLFVCAFTLVIHYEEGKQEVQYNKILSIWLPACEKYEHIIVQTVEVYLDKRPKKSLVLFKERLNLLLDYMTKDGVKQKSVFCPKVFSGFARYFGTLVKDLTNNNDQKIRNESIIYAFEFYMEFIEKVNRHYKTPHDIFQALENYAILLGFLFKEGYSRNCVLSDKTALEYLVSTYLELYKRCTVIDKLDRVKHKYIAETAIPHINKEMQKVLKKYQAHFACNTAKKTTL